MSRLTTSLLLMAFIALGLSFVPSHAGTEQSSDLNLVDPIAAGRDLFQVKGCVTCHQHDAVTGIRDQLEIGPDLSAYQGNEAFLAAWLADPGAVRENADMPDLELTQTEIEYLTAFLLGD